MGAETAMKDNDPVQVTLPSALVIEFQNWIRQKARIPGVRLIYGGTIQEQTPSCLIAAIGTDFMPGVQEALQAAIGETANNGWQMTFMAIKNLCIEPFRGLGAMRNWAAQEALAGGYDYLLTVDNDVLFEEKDALLRLLRRGQIVVVPWYDQRPYQKEDSDGIPWDYLTEPLLAPNQGLIPIQWAAVSCVLYNVVVFRYAGQRLWTDALISNEEAYYFKALRNLGIRLWQDTDVHVSLLKGPTPVWKVLGRQNPNPGE